MENATDALKMAFAVFVFIVALSIFFSLYTQVKATADSILLNSDKTTYYEWEEGDTEDGRIVAEDTVIATLHSQSKEQIYVQIELNGSTTLFTPTSSSTEKTNYINTYLNKGYQYKEKIMQITVGGVSRTAEDGTKIIITPGSTRTYVIYTKK